MSDNYGINSAQQSASVRSLARLFALIAAIALVFTVAITAAIPDTQQAYAAIKSTEELVSDESASAEEPDAADDEGESIEDEENPMSSGLGGGEPVSDAVNVTGVAVGGIVAVGAFFFVLMRKLNNNIKDMDSMFR